MLSPHQIKVVLHASLIIIIIIYLMYDVNWYIYSCCATSLQFTNLNAKTDRIPIPSGWCPLHILIICKSSLSVSALGSLLSVILQLFDRKRKNAFQLHYVMNILLLCYDYANWISTGSWTVLNTYKYFESNME